MFDKFYIAGFGKIQRGDICYGSKGEPLTYIDRVGDIIRLETASGNKVKTDISNIRLVQHEHYRSFSWITAPGARIASAAAKEYGYHPRQLLAIGEWSNPLTEEYEGKIVNKRVTDGSGIARSIPDTLPVIWVDSSKIDLNYIPEPTELVDNIPAPIREYSAIPKLYIDIETTGLDPACDRIIMFGVRNHLSENAIFTDRDEKQLLIDAIVYIRQHRPDLMFLHNGYGFDIPFIIARCDLHGISHPFRECESQVQRTLKKNAHGVLKRVFEVDPNSPEYGGKMTAYEAFNGDTIIIDTMVAIGLWDTGKTLPNLKLKPTVINLKLRADIRLELSNEEIQSYWVNNDIDRLREYLIFDLEDTQLLADKIMPNIWYQQAYIPNVGLMELVHKNTGFKVQKMYEHLCPERPEASAATSEKSVFIDSKADYGGGLTGAVRGCYRNVAKIDVASLYPSLMVRYRLGSRKDTKGRYISVLSKMLTDRLAYKQAGKDGDRAAAGMAEAIKLLMNSGYGFLGTQGYTFNDMENAAIVTAYGRVILQLMCKTIEDNGGVLISTDTDGVYFSHPHQDLIFNLVSDVLPDGINIELEKENMMMFSLAKKNYCLYFDDGSIELKGNSLLSSITPVETNFVKTYPTILLNEGQAKADKYYQKVVDNLIKGNIPIADLTLTEQILPTWKRKMWLLGIDRSSIVTYYYSRSDAHPQRRQYAKSRGYKELETAIEHYPVVPYFWEYYAYLIECLRADMLNLPKPKEDYKVKQTGQLYLTLDAA